MHHHHHPTENDELLGAAIVAQGIRNQIKQGPSHDDLDGFPWVGLIVAFIIGCVVLGPLMIVIVPIVLILFAIKAIIG